VAQIIPHRGKVRNPTAHVHSHTHWTRAALEIQNEIVIRSRSSIVPQRLMASSPGPRSVP
jgi:hypothetical protein